jgi:hypothetical protein
MTIYLDFDQTVNSNPYPEIGEPVPGSIETIKLLIDNGHRIILNTARIEVQGIQAINKIFVWFMKHGIDLHGHTNSKLHPLSYSWAMAFLKNAGKFFIVNNENYLYIDDIGEGVPITQYNGHEVVDWKRVKSDLLRCGMIIDRSAETGTMIYRKSQDVEEEE